MAGDREDPVGDDVVARGLDRVDEHGHAQARHGLDLAAGIHWVLEEADEENLKKACLQKVMHNYSQHAVALKYVEVYNQAMAFKNYRI